MTLKEKLAFNKQICREFAADADKYQALYEELLEEVEIFVNVTEGVIQTFHLTMNPHAMRVYKLLSTEDFFLRFKFHIEQERLNQIELSNFDKTYFPSI